VSLTPRVALVLYAAVLVAAVLTMLGSAAAAQTGSPGTRPPHVVSARGGSVHS
jgi:hypothetical protein